ncbi:MAG: cell envelope integrity EipB family protein [Hyphomicrobiaceae bacterium]|nr:cell envelope integrity EipB family protein [Hyphomicrobiaceae bacterium]
MIDAIGFVARTAVASVLVALAAPAVAAGPAVPVPSVDVTPHRAVYSMTLASAKNSSGVIAAHGALSFEWGDSCDGWTIEQRYKLQLVFAQNVEVEITTNYITWESKDGTSYRFKVRKTKNGKPEEEISGTAELDGAKGGTADFTLPARNAMKLPAGTIFPTQHTLLLLERARAGDRMVPRVVFDGATAEGASLVSALIGRALPAPEAATDALLKRPGWAMRMAYFGIDKADTAEPDYEIGMDLQDNGVARGIRLDYTDFSIKGTLEKLEPLAKPPC